MGGGAKRLLNRLNFTTLAIQLKNSTKNLFNPKSKDLINNETRIESKDSTNPQSNNKTTINPQLNSNPQSSLLTLSQPEVSINNEFKIESKTQSPSSFSTISHQNPRKSFNNKEFNHQSPENPSSDCLNFDGENFQNKLDCQNTANENFVAQNSYNLEISEKSSHQKIHCLNNHQKSCENFDNKEFHCQNLETQSPNSFSTIRHQNPANCKPDGRKTPLAVAYQKSLKQNPFKKAAFSLIDLLISLIIISAFSSVLVSNAAKTLPGKISVHNQFSTNCSKFSSECKFCEGSKYCVICDRICDSAPNQCLDHDSCSCVPCS